MELNEKKAKYFGDFNTELSNESTSSSSLSKNVLRYVIRSLI